MVRPKVFRSDLKTQTSRLRPSPVSCSWGVRCVTLDLVSCDGAASCLIREDGSIASKDSIVSGSEVVGLFLRAWLRGANLISVLALRMSRDAGQL